MSKTRPTDAVVEQRRQGILDYVIECREARIDDLTSRFGVSLMTMHRDLDDLAERRLLRKQRGKVSALATDTGTSRQEIEALGEVAAREVEPGQTVFVDDSTTLFPLVRQLVNVEGLTILTNSLQVARLAVHADVVLLGGRYNAEFDSCAGPDVLAALDRIRADIAFVSVTAVAVGRLYHPVRDYAELKKAALRTANRNVLVVDHTKFGRTATYAHGLVDDYDLLITSEATPTEEVEAALNAGTAIELVECDPEGPEYDI